MNAADFILIQVDKKDEFYELARVRPYKCCAYYKNQNYVRFPRRYSSIYYDKTTDTCVGDYAKCTVKQTHR